MTRRTIWLWMLALAALAGVALAAAAVREREPPVSKVRVIEDYPHDAKAFTQGLVIHEGQLYEGTGLEGQSSLRRVDLETGKVDLQMNLDRPWFGEGITILDDQIFQLTWRNRVVLIYERDSLRYLRSQPYAGEGWGLTTDGKSLILSDGSATLKFLNPKTFQVTRRVAVKAGRKSVTNLNELEYVKGEVWANIWYSDRIARINPETGDVSGWVDLAALWPVSRRPSKEHVLNGIAYDAKSERLFVTGKNWPRLYEIELVK